MAFDAHKNFSYSTIATAPSPALSGTSLVVQSGDGAKFPTVPFNATVWPAGVQPTSDVAEIVRVTNRSTDTLTITRAQEGSSARSIGVGDQISATITAKTLTDVEAAAGLLHTVASSGATLTVDYSTANNWDITLTANCTFTLSGATSGDPDSLLLMIRQDGTGSRTVTWPGSVTWIGGVAPTLHSGASQFDVISLFTFDGGTNWYGMQAAPPTTFSSAEVTTDQSTSTSSYTDLATTGPAATVTVGASGILLVGWSCQFDGTTNGAQMSVALSGATTTAASDQWALYCGGLSNGMAMGRTYVFTSLTSGSTTVTAKYKSPSAASVGFQRRSIWAQAL